MATPVDDHTTARPGPAPLTREDMALLVSGYASRLEAHRTAVAAVRRRCERTVFGGRLANEILDLLGDLR